MGIQEEPALFALPARSREAKDDKIFCVLFGRLHRCRRRRRRRRRRLQGDERRTCRQRRIRRGALNIMLSFYISFIYSTLPNAAAPKQKRRLGTRIHTHYIKCKEKRREEVFCDTHANTRTLYYMI